MQTLLHNAMLVLPERVVEKGWLLIEDGRIAGLGEDATCPNPRTIERSVDVRTHFLLPGLIDLHGNLIGKLAAPRPNVSFDLSVALHEADWQLTGCGITTEFHAVALDDNEFVVRSDNYLRELLEAIYAGTTSLLVRHKIHARLELTSQRGFNIIKEMIAERKVDLVSLMDHSPGQGQYTTEQAYREYVMRVTNRSLEEVDAFLAFKRSQVVEIPSRIESVTQQAQRAGIIIAIHDADTPEKVEQFCSLGITLTEFPTTLEAALRAHELGLVVSMGAPNAFRGQSSAGNLNALDALRIGIVDVLCSDYYPASLLMVVFKLAAQNMLTLPFVTQLVTLNAAKAVGLGNDLGSLEPGKIADLVVVTLSHQRLPIVQRVFVDGKERVARD